MMNENLPDESSPTAKTIKNTRAGIASRKLTESDEINIKHRLVGAAILITLGVIILPLLLGSYSNNDADSTDTPPPVVENSPDIQNSAFKDIEEDDIKVFVSKIRPREDSVNNEVVLEQKTSESLMSSKKVAPLNQQVSINAKKTEKTSDDELKAKLAKSMAKPLIKRKEPLSNAIKSELKAKPGTKAATPVKRATELVKATPVKTIPKPQVNEKSVTEGYIVSVGVYLQLANAENVSKKLKNKGFKPSQGLFNTSKGKATRVWLGPFATRAEAGKKKAKLEQALGERGLIKRYP